MNVRDLTIPELVLIVGTRVALGIGVGLLLSNRLDRSPAHRGWIVPGAGRRLNHHSPGNECVG